jgi:hypothetical protein
MSCDCGGIASYMRFVATHLAEIHTLTVVEQTQRLSVLPDCPVYSIDLICIAREIIRDRELAKHKWMIRTISRSDAQSIWATAVERFSREYTNTWSVVD